MTNMMRHTFPKTCLVLISSLVMVGLSACNKSSDSGNSSGGGYAGTTDCSGYRYYNQNTGGYTTTVYDPARGTCVDPITGQAYGQPVGTNYLSFFSQNWDGSTYSNFQYVNSYNYYNPVKNMTITNSSTYQSFLKKAMGVCDQGQSNGGTASCSTWASGGFDLVLQAGYATNTTARVTARAWPQQQGYYQFNYSFPNAGQLLASFFGFPVFAQTGAYLNPLALDLTLSPINNSAGFEGRGYGNYYSQANRSLIQLQVATGKLENASFNYTLSFEGVTFATGKFQRCQTVDCGTMSFFGN